LHKSALIHLFAVGKKAMQAALKLLASAFAAVGFRNVLQLQWTMGCAEAQGACGAVAADIAPFAPTA
jgi:hypothetical protein